MSATHTDRKGQVVNYFYHDVETVTMVFEVKLIYPDINVDRYVEPWLFVKHVTRKLTFHY